MAKEIKSRLVAVFAQAYSIGHEFAQIPTKFYVAAALSIPAASHAIQGSGGLFTGWKNAMNDIIGLLVLAATLAGIGAVLYGLTQLVKKGMGRGDDVEWRQVYWPLGGGAMLTVLMYMVRGLVVESGAAESDMGVTRTF